MKKEMNKLIWSAKSSSVYSQNKQLLTIENETILSTALHARQISRIDKKQ